MTLMTDDYLCHQCGNITPIANEFCPACGHKMVEAKTAETSLSEDGGEDQTEQDAKNYNSDGAESLEDLRAREVEEDNDNYSGEE